MGMANGSERRRQWNFVVAGLGCYKKWPVKKRVFTEDRSKPKPPVWSLIIGIFFLYQFQLKCGCELNDQIESFNFDSFLWPIEQVWVLGLLSILLCFIFFFFFFFFFDNSNVTVTWMIGLIFCLFVFCKFQLNCGCEFSGQIEGCNFGISLSLFLRFSIFFIWFLLGSIFV